MKKLDDVIEEGHPSCLCALCDTAMMESDQVKIVYAHGNAHLVHFDCWQLYCEEASDDAKEES